MGIHACVVVDPLRKNQTFLELQSYRIAVLDANPTLEICHYLPVSDSQIPTKSGSVESKNDPSPKSKVMHETKLS